MDHVFFLIMWMALCVISSRRVGTRMQIQCIKPHLATKYREDAADILQTAASAEYSQDPRLPNTYSPDCNLTQFIAWRFLNLLS